MQETTSVFKPNRRIFLWVFSMFSLFANAVIIVIHFFLLFRGPALQFILKIPVIDTIAEEGLHGNILYYLLKIDFHAFCLYAVILIFRLKRYGFYFYIVSQFILLTLPFLFLRSLGISYLLINMGVSTIFSLFFIMLFWLYLPQMTKNTNFQNNI
jgi:hypothetical protein